MRFLRLRWFIRILREDLWAAARGGVQSVLLALCGDGGRYDRTANVFADGLRTKGATIAGSACNMDSFGGVVCHIHLVCEPLRCFF